MKNIFFFLILGLALSSCLERPETAKVSGSTQLPSTTPPLPINHPAPNNDLVAKSTAEDPSILGTRFYLRSVFEETFQDTDTRAALQIILDKYLGALDDKGESGGANFENITIFGAPCDVYSAAGSGVGCNNSRSNIFNPVYAPATPSRESLRVKICSEVTSQDPMITVALAKISFTTATTFSQNNFQILFEQFYPGVTATSEVSSSFNNLWAVMTTGGESAMDKWRMIYFTVCRTPEWQIL